MRLTYTKQRGYHHWVCQLCGKYARERIPDQADCRFGHNPGNPWLGICGDCNGGSPSAGIRLGNSSLPPQPQLDGEAPRPRLDGEWGEYWEIARRFERKARAGDWEDLRHDIIVRLADIAREYQAKGKPLTEWGMIRVAAYTARRYWYQKARRGRITSLNTPVDDEDGSETEIWETLADDKAIDLDAWVDARLFLLGCPDRLIQIARKRQKRIALSGADYVYLNKFRKRLFRG